MGKLFGWFVSIVLFYGIMDLWERKYHIAVWWWFWAFVGATAFLYFGVPAIFRRLGDAMERSDIQLARRRAEREAADERARIEALPLHSPAEIFRDVTARYQNGGRKIHDGLLSRLVDYFSELHKNGLHMEGTEYAKLCGQYAKSLQALTPLLPDTAVENRPGPFTVSIQGDEKWVVFNTGKDGRTTCKYDWRYLEMLRAAAGVFPSEDRPDHWEEMDEEERITWGTPIHHSLLFGIMVYPAPFDLPQEKRFQHQFIVAPTGSGKTNFLSAMIAEDLKKVERGEASVFVMDSKNSELSRYLPRLKCFAPGGSLAGKLIYLEPDIEHPLALNIFDNGDLASASPKERAALYRAALDMLRFFLSSILKTELTSHQDPILRWIMQALLTIPDATIFTLKELAEDGGYNNLKSRFVDLDPEVRKWLETRLYNPDIKVSRSAISNRIDAMMADPDLREMFRYPRRKVDLFVELQTPKVVVINTNRAALGDGVEPLGRFFLAQLLHMARKRMILPKASRLPVYAYVDEAADYIGDEPKVADLIDEAREPRVAMTFAIQREKDIPNANVLDALKHASIQCWGQEPPHFNIAIRPAEPIRVTVPKVAFSAMPQMTDDQWEATKQDMHRRYSVPASTSTFEQVPRSAAPHTATLPTDDDDRPYTGMKV